MEKMIFTILVALFAIGVNAQNDSIAADSIVASQPVEVSQANNGMTPEQLFQLEMVRLNKQVENGLVPIVAIISPFLFCFLFIIGYFIYSYNTKKRKYELVKVAIENGREIPADLFNEKKSEPKNRLQTSLYQIGIGIGLMILFAFLEDDLIGVGAIPLFIGIGQFIAYRIEQEKINNQTAAACEQEGSIKEKNAVVVPAKQQEQQPVEVIEYVQVIESTKNKENE